MDAIADDASGTNKYAQYQYVGSSMIASISHPEVTGGLNLSYGASGTYGGWDRFGRVVDQLWTDDSANTIDQIEHTYDRGGNRLTRTNGLNSALDEVYTYDGLDRLIDTNRGGADLQDWSLDALGNWRGFTDGATTQTRTGNAANEITGISGGGWIAPTYDAAGNMTSGPKPDAETTRLHFKYDAWNRLVEVKDDNAGVPGTTIATYEYDGRNYRVEKAVGTDTFDVFYNEAWQVLEVRKNGDTDPLEQNIWDQRYIDAPIVRFYDANTDGDYADAGDSTLYYVQDANFNVTALVDATTGNVVERYSYDPYGKATVYDANWTVRSAGSAYNNELGYASYRLDPETALYQVRNRFYHTAIGTWISRDPIGYAGGINVYEYVGSSPANATDPTGLAKSQFPGTKIDFAEFNRLKEGVTGDLISRYADDLAIRLAKRIGLRGPLLVRFIANLPMTLVRLALFGGSQSATIVGMEANAAGDILAVIEPGGIRRSVLIRDPNKPVIVKVPGEAFGCFKDKEIAPSWYELYDELYKTKLALEELRELNEIAE